MNISGGTFFGAYVGVMGSFLFWFVTTVNYSGGHSDGLREGRAEAERDCRVEKIIREYTE